MRLALRLAACVAPQVPGGGGAPGEEAVTIGWARHGGETDLGTEGALAEMFNAKHPGVVVEPLVLPWNDYNAKIPIMVAGGTAPDTFGAHPALLKETYDAQGLIPIDPYIDANAEAVDYDDILYPGDASFDGQIVGLPQKSCTHQVRFNKDLFAEAGMTTPGELYWAEGEDGWNVNSFVEMGKELTKDLDGDGIPDQYFFSGISGTYILSVIRAFGGDVVNEDLSACTLTYARSSGSNSVDGRSGADAQHHAIPGDAGGSSWA